MAKLQLLAGTTSKLAKIFVQDTSKTNGAGLTGLAFGTSGLTCYYIREGASSTTSVTLQTATLGTWTTRGFIVVDGTNMPGLYEFGIPDAAIAAGAKSVVIYFQGAANMAPTIIEIELTAVDNQSTAFGLSLAKTTNITGFNDIAATAIVSSGAITTSGGAVSTVSAVTGLTASNLDATISSRMATYTQPTGFLAATFPSGTVANTTNITAGTITTATNLTTNNDKTGYSLTQSFPTNFSSLSISAGGKVGVDGTSSLTESYAALHASPTLAQLLFEVRALLAENSISSTTVTTKKLDGSTTAHTYTLDSSTAPTSITTAS